jgi:hypothetical protein
MFIIRAPKVASGLNRNAVCEAIEIDLAPQEKRSVDPFDVLPSHSTAALVADNSGVRRKAEPLTLAERSLRVECSSLSLTKERPTSSLKAIREDIMANDREQEIRKRAYELWEQEGKPHGDDLRHWLKALEQFGKGAAPLAKSKRTARPKASAEFPAETAPQAENPRAKEPAVEITTGKKPPGKPVKRVEGP